MNEKAKKVSQSNSTNRGNDSKELEDLRVVAVKLYIKGHMTPKDIIATIGIGESTLWYWVGVYKRKGLRGLRAKKGKGGRHKSKEKNLTNKQKELLRSVVMQEPRKTRKLMLDFGLRTVKYIQHAIKILFDKDLKEWKTREILLGLGFTNQKPLFRAYQQNPEKVEKRLDEELPLIMNEADEEERTIYYGDEAGFKSANHRGKTWGIKGETPIVTATGARFGVNAISIISPRGELKFMAYEGTFTSDTLLLFLKKLVHKNNKKKTIIFDGHPTHKTKKIKAYLVKINHQIKIYYLPGYSPELNPDEQVWLHVHNDLKGTIVANKKHLIDKVRQSLYRQQKQKDKVASYFRHPDVRRKSD